MPSHKSSGRVARRRPYRSARASVEYIRGGRQVQSIDLRPGSDEYELSVRDAATQQASPAAVVVNPTDTYFANVPDPVVLELRVRRDDASKGGKKTLAVVFSSWLN